METFLRAILGELANDRLLEFRFIKDGEVDPQFYSDFSTASHEALDLAGMGWDVYFGVVPRTRKGSKAVDCEQSVSVLWADYDAKAFDNDKIKAFFALASVNPQPQIIVDSGHGYHAYWLLSDPASYAAAKDAMVGISMATGSDNCSDLPRILRVPETYNFKYQGKEPVRVIRMDLLARKYRINDFIDYIETVRRQEWFEKKMASERVRPETPVELDHLPDWLQELILVGAKPGEDRSAQCFKVVCRLIESGWADDRIEGLFAANPDGIGQKYAEKNGDAERWLRTTIRAAKKKLSSQAST